MGERLLRSYLHDVTTIRESDRKEKGDSSEGVTWTVSVFIRYRHLSEQIVDLEQNHNCTAERNV